jgi:hypothetical protein
MVSINSILVKTIKEITWGEIWTFFGHDQPHPKYAENLSELSCENAH